MNEHKKWLIMFAIAIVCMMTGIITGYLDYLQYRSSQSGNEKPVLKSVQKEIANSSQSSDLRNGHSTGVQEHSGGSTFRQPDRVGKGNPALAVSVAPQQDVVHPDDHPAEPLKTPAQPETSKPKAPSIATIRIESGEMQVLTGKPTSAIKPSRDPQSVTIEVDGTAQTIDNVYVFGEVGANQTISILLAGSQPVKATFIDSSKLSYMVLSHNNCVFVPIDTDGKLEASILSIDSDVVFEMKSQSPCKIGDLEIGQFHLNETTYTTSRSADAGAWPTSFFLDLPTPGQVLPSLSSDLSGVGGSISYAPKVVGRRVIVDVGYDNGAELRQDVHLDGKGHSDVRFVGDSRVVGERISYLRLFIS